VSTSCDPCNFLYEEPPATSDWREGDPLHWLQHEALAPAAPKPVAPATKLPEFKPPTVTAPQAITAPRKAAPPVRQNVALPPKPLTHHERFLPRAEDAARQLVRCWIENGPKQMNHFDPESMPTGPLQEVAGGVLDAMLNNGVKDFAGCVAYFTAAPQPVRDELSECAQGFAPRPSDCQPLLSILRDHDRERQRETLAHRLRAVLDRCDDPAGILAEIAELESAGTRKYRSMIVCGVNTYPTLVPKETVILGNGWVRRGDVITFVSGAGGGKSVAATQMAMAWALGLPYFGIRPPRALRILLFSGEDDGVTIGQCREGFLLHSKLITGRQLTAAALDPLDAMIRTEFIREHVGERFHEHLTALLQETPADLVIINPLLSFIGGEIVAKASEWLRAGLMPVLQTNDCAALVIHHTPKLSKDSWDTIDDTYSAIGGGEIANIPRSVLTLKPTPSDGLFVVTVSKRQTTGWKDGDGKFTASYFVRRSGDPERPAWLPVDHEEAQDMIGACRPSRGAAAGSGRKATTEHVVEALSTGAMQQVALVDWLRKNCQCSDRPAKDAIRDAALARRIVETFEKNPRGGHAVKWLTLTEHINQGVEPPTL